jgi:hypothetical protein
LSSLIVTAFTVGRLFPWKSQLEPEHGKDTPYQTVVGIYEPKPQGMQEYVAEPVCTCVLSALVVVQQRSDTVDIREFSFNGVFKSPREQVDLTNCGRRLDDQPLCFYVVQWNWQGSFKSSAEPFLIRGEPYRRDDEGLTACSWNPKLSNDDIEALKKELEKIRNQYQRGEGKCIFTMTEHSATELELDVHYYPCEDHPTPARFVRIGQLP